MVGKTRSEDTLIFSALTPDITKMSNFYDALEDYFKKKKESDQSDRFNIILFQEDGPNYLEDFTLYPETILLALKSLEPMLVRGNVAGGIFVAMTFIIDVFKRIPAKCFRLIMLTDSGSLRIPDQYIPVLENLIDQVKDFPFFIDVIRINIDDPREDLKLMKLSRRCNGDIHELNDVRGLGDILDVLALKKEIPNALLREKDQELPEELQPFYENLAEEPSEVKGEATCAVCFKKDSKGLVKCEKCGTIVHKKCWSQWAKSSNIGIFNVFRCHNCYNLIKLNKEYVFAIRTGEIPPEERVIVKEKNYQEFLENLETEEGPKIVQVEDSLPVTAEESDHMKSDLSVEIQFEDDQQLTDKIDQAAKEEFSTKSDEELKIIWCPACNKITTNEYKNCPSCGKPLC